MALDSFHGVLRTGGHEPAGMRQHRRNEPLIAAQYELDRLLHFFCPPTRARCVAKVKPRATSSTNSAGPSHADEESRTASRILRLMRFRSTAPPSTLPTVKPIRGLDPASGP